MISQPFFDYREWLNEPEIYIYLGSERNPQSKRCYDYYAVNTYGMSQSITETTSQGILKRNTAFTCSWSFTYRHGMEPWEYGSGPICVCYNDDRNLYTDNMIMKDWLYGSYMAQKLTLYYLATGLRPHVEDVGLPNTISHEYPSFQQTAMNTARRVMEELE